MYGLAHRIAGCVSLCAALGLPPPVAAQGPATAEDASSGQPLETVTVRGRRMPERFDTTGSTLTLRREQIEALGANTVGDILRGVPGLQVSTTANGGLEIRMRGMSAQATRILIDGAPVSVTRRDAQLPLDDLPADLIERVEVVRAPTAEYEGAAGGTVNIVLRSAAAKRETYVWLTDQHIWGRDALAVFASQTGPLGAAPSPRRDADTPAGGLADDAARWTYFVSLSGGPRNLGADTRQSSSVSEPAGSGEVDDASRLRSTTWTLTPRLQGRLGASDRVNVRSLFSSVDQHGQTTSSGVLRDARGDTTLTAFAPWAFRRDHGQIAVDWDHRFAGGRLETTLGFDRSRSRYALQRDVSLQSDTGAVLRASALAEDRSERGVNAKGKLTTVRDGSIWSVGAEFTRAALDVDGLTTSDAGTSPRSVGATLTSGALWLQDEVPVEAWETTVVAGLRAQRHVIDALDSGALRTTSDETFWQPSVNSRTRLTDDAQLRLNLARITRTPRIWELLDRPVPTPATNSPNSPDFRGNPGLRPESTVTLDIGTDHRIGERGQAGLGVFVRDQHDVIARRLSLDGTRWTERPDNVGDAIVWGIESDLRTDLRWAGLPADWTLSANANIYRSRMLSGDTVGERIPGQARYIANLSVARPLRTSGGWYGGSSIALTGRADLAQPAADGVRIDGTDHSRAQLDAYIGSVLPAFGFWRLNIYNLTDFRRDARRTVVDANGVVFGSRSVQTLTPRVFLTVGTRF